MSLRLGRTALIALALIGPATSFAHTDAAIDACVQAFLSSDVAKGRKVTVRTPAAYSYTPRPFVSQTIRAICLPESRPLATTCTVERLVSSSGRGV